MRRLRMCGMWSKGKDGPDVLPRLSVRRWEKERHGMASTKEREQTVGENERERQKRAERRGEHKTAGQRRKTLEVMSKVA